MSGKSLRLGRIFREDGRALVLAFDHGMGMGPTEGLIHPDETIASVISGGVDAILTSPGIAMAYPRLFRNVGLILRLDGAWTTVTGVGCIDAVYTVKTALRLGADAVGCMGFVGGEGQGRTLKYLGQLVQDCVKWQVPLMAEMVIVGKEGTFVNDDLEKVALAARTGAEAGADFIKTTFAGDAQSFRKVVDGCFRPVLVLGGSRQDDLDLLRMVRTAMDAGASGAVIGRNIWQHCNPETMVRALTQVIHSNIAPEAACETLRISR
jgi:DhnA family fructose-bisphosphate aldolase class Ia